MMRTLGQKRASFALKEVLNQTCNDPKEFKAFCAGAPAVILQNGFGQALAFWYAKGKEVPKDKHHIVLAIILKWLCLKENDVSNEFLPPCRNTKEMVQSLSAMSQQQYLAAQREALALLEWVKRYANALVKGERT